jgi:hypothetical protein
MSIKQLLIGMSKYSVISDYPSEGISVSHTKDCKELYVTLKIVSPIDLTDYVGQYCKISGVKTLPFINNVDKSRFEIVSCHELLKYNDIYIYKISLKNLV